jgi:hypothetical protein
MSPATTSGDVDKHTKVFRCSKKFKRAPNKVEAHKSSPTQWSFNQHRGSVRYDGSLITHTPNQL